MMDLLLGIELAVAAIVLIGMVVILGIDNG